MENRRLISVDIETTGLDHEKCEILSIGAVVINLDTREKENTFYGVLNHKNFYAEPYALMLNAALIARIADGGYEEVSGDGSVYIKDEKETVLKYFLEWLQPFKQCCVVGKNFGTFDLKFFEKAYGHNPFNRRIVDVGSVYFDLKVDSKVPNLSECLDKAGMNNTVTHNALDDAQQVADLVLHKVRGIVAVDSYTFGDGTSAGGTSPYIIGIDPYEPVANSHLDCSNPNG